MRGALPWIELEEEQRQQVDAVYDIDIHRPITIDVVTGQPLDVGDHLKVMTSIGRVDRRWTRLPGTRSPPLRPLELHERKHPTKRNRNLLPFIVRRPR